MRVILIIIVAIIYFSIGACIAAVEECNRYDETGKCGLKPFIYFFWPLYLIYCWIKTIIKKISNNDK